MPSILSRPDQWLGRGRWYVTRVFLQAIRARRSPCGGAGRAHGWPGALRLETDVRQQAHLPAGTRQCPRRVGVCGDAQPRLPPSRKGTIAVTPPESAVRHDPADQVGEDPTAGADAARAYRDFWTDVGSTFPDLHGARSTAQYLEDEQWLFQTHLAPLEGLRILKTDLWDEAKNTRILGWAAEAGSCAFGVDISPGIVRSATRNFEERDLTLHGVRSDVRALPFPSGSFDAVYSMGTVEHFADTDGAVREIFRVVRPGGRVVIGVPNRWDPFLRPLLVVLLYRLGLYGYGFEKSYSRRTFRRMLTRAGFEVTAETGILFIPGWLRMLDLACYTWARPLSRLTGLAVAPFHHLSRWLPWLRRYGYLLATVAVRPAAAGAPSPQRVS